jgi:hypothetical protein
VAATQYSSGALQKSLNVQVCSHDSVSIVVARHSIAHLADAALDAPAALKVNRCLGIWSSSVFFQNIFLHFGTFTVKFQNEVLDHEMI